MLSAHYMKEMSGVSYESGWIDGLGSLSTFRWQQGDKVNQFNHVESMIEEKEASL